MDSIDLGRAIKAPFADQGWVNKTLLGWLWVLLGVTVPAVYGAQLDYIRSVAEGREDLPDWSNFGDKWVRGFLLMVAIFVYLLPVWILGFIFAVPGIIALATSNGNTGGGLLGGGMCLFFLVAVVYGLAIAVLLYGATVNYALKGQFGALFAFSEIMGHIRDGSGYFAAWLWALVISFGGSVVVSILSATVIGYIAVPAVTYLMVMMVAHVFGQWAARSYGVAQVAPTYAQPGYMPPSGMYAPPPPTAPSYPPPAAPGYVPPAPPTPPVAPSYTPQPPMPPAAPQPPMPPAAPQPPAGPTAPAPDSGFTQEVAPLETPPSPQVEPPAAPHGAPSRRRYARPVDFPARKTRPAGPTGGPLPVLKTEEGPVATRSRRRRHRAQTENPRSHAEQF